MPADQGALRRHAARLKHDLGKYVSFQARWLPDSASVEMVAEAVRADLLSTRRGPAGEQDALEVWQGFRPVLVGEQHIDGQLVDLSDAPAFRHLDEAMQRLAEHVHALKLDGHVDLVGARRDALAVADSCKALLAWISSPEWTWPTS